MADARYIIDVILKARDDASRVLNEATGNISRFNQEWDQTQRDFKQGSDAVSRSLQGVADQSRRVKQDIKDLGNESKNTRDAYIRLERAAKDLARTEADTSRSARESLKERQTAAKELKDARAALTKTLIEEEQAEKRVAQARTLEAQKTELAAARYERLEKALERIAKNRDAMAKTFDPRQVDQHAAAIRKDLEAMRRLEFTSERVKEIQDEVFDTARVERQRIATERLAASQDRMRRNMVEYMRTVERVAQLERERDRGGRTSAQRAKLELDISDAQTQASALAGEIGDFEANIRLNDAQAMAEWREFKASVGGDMIQANVELDTMRARAEMAALDTTANQSKSLLREMSEEVSENFARMSQNIAAFDNVLRGMFSLGITAFMQQIVIIAIAAAGALSALASSAIAAGGALGGALVAGIGQAIPALGVLASAIGRVTGVMKAVQQANLLQQQQSYAGADAANQQANAIDQVASATDSLRGAQDNLRDANTRVLDAQRTLTNARRDAKTQLEDLIMKEREAELAAQGAALSQVEAQKALQDAIRRGDTAGVQRAQLRVTETDQGMEEATTRRARATTERRRGVAQGVEGSEAVMNAQRGLERARASVVDAERAIDRAERGLARARRSAAEAGAGMTAAAGKLAFMQSQMSAAERRLFEAATRLQDVWRVTSQRISEPLINAFTFATNRIIQIIQRPTLVNAARGLSASMATQFRRVFSAFTDRRAMDQFLFFTREASRNMRPLGQSAINLGRAFMNIGVIASPVLRQFLGLIQNITARFQAFTASARGRNYLAQFFQVGFQATRAWLGLLGSLGRLFLAIMGPGGGAKAGIGILNDMTRVITRLAKAIETPGTALNRFFNRLHTMSRAMIRDLAPIFQALGTEINKTFGGDARTSVQGFAQFIAKFLIPAFFEFIRLVGGAVAAVGRFTEAHPRLARTFAQVAGALLALGVASKVAAFFLPLRAVFTVLLARMTGLIPATSLLGRAFTVLGGAARFMLGPFGLIALAIVLLLRRMGLLDDVWRGVQRAFRGFVNNIRPGIAALQRAFRDVGELVGGNSPLGRGIRAIARFFVSGFVQALVLAARALGNILGGALRIIGGLISVVSNLLQGNWSKAWKSMGEVVQGAWQIIKGVIQAILAGLLVLGLRIGIGLVRGIVRGLAGLARAILGLFRGAWNQLLRWLGISSPSTKAQEIGEAIVEGIRNGLRAIWRVITWPFRTAFNFVSDKWKELVDKFKTVSFKDVWTDLKDAFKNAINEVIKMWNRLGFRLKLPAPVNREIKIDTPNIPLLRQQGGRIGRGYGGGDRIPVLAEEGEYMVRKEAVSRLGMSFMERLNAIGGGRGGPAHGFGFQTGGAPRRAAGQRADQGGQNADFTEFVAAVENAGKKAIEEWGKMWTRLRGLTKSGFDFLFNTGKKRLNELSAAFRSEGGEMSRAMTNTMNSVKKSVSTGMGFVGDAVNRALKAFGVPQVNLTVQDTNRPERDAAGGFAGRPIRASGGFLGMPGERGGDYIHALLGRGEAVLNWAHQKMVDPALRAMYGYGLEDLFSKNRALHAGTYSQAMGYAKGGIVPVTWQGGQGNMPFPGHEGVNRAILEIVRSLSKRFKALITDGYGPGHQSPGHTETGMAVDFVPGPGGNWDLIEAMGKWAVKQGHVVGYGAGVPGSQAWPDHGRNHHIHIDFSGNLSALPSIPELKDLIVKGTPGKMKDLVQKALNRVTGAGRKFIADKMPTGEAMVVPGTVYRGELDRVFPRQSPLQIAPEAAAMLAQKAGLPGITYAQIAKGESNFRPGAVSPDGGYGLWQMTPRVQSAATRAKWESIGSYFNPWNNARMAKVLAGSGTGVSNYYGDQYKTGDNLHWSPGKKVPNVATGGILGGIAAFKRFAAGKMGFSSRFGEWDGSLMGAKHGFRPLVALLHALYGLVVGSGLRPGATIQGTGRRSNHAIGQAVDLVTKSHKFTDIRGKTGEWIGRMDSANNYLKRHFSGIKLDHLWRTETGGNHYDHIHFGMQASHANSPRRVLEHIKRTIGVNAIRALYGGAAPAAETGAEGETDPGTTGDVAPPALLSYEALRPVLPAGMRGASYEPNSPQFKSWFTRAFGTDPGKFAINPSFGRVASSMFAGMRAWTINMINAFRARVTTGGEGTGTGVEGETVGDSRLPANKGIQKFEFNKTSPFVNRDHRPVVGGIYRGKASYLASKRSGMGSHLGLGLGGYWLLKAPNGAVAIWRQTDSTSGRLERLFDLTPGAMQGFPGSSLARAGTQEGWGGMFLGKTLPRGLRTGEFSGIPGFAKGGTIPGQDGEPVGIIAHAGEMILNRMHQAKLGGAAYLRKILGFTGGPTSFQGGGVVEGRSWSGGPTTPGTRPRGVAVIENLANVVNHLAGLDPNSFSIVVWDRFIAGARAIAAQARDAAKRLPNISAAVMGAVGSITGEGGLLEVLAAGVEQFAQVATNAMKMTTYAITGGGTGVRLLKSAEQQAQEQIDIFKNTLKMNQDRLAIAQETEATAMELLERARKEGNAQDIQVAETALQEARDKVMELETVVADGTVQLAEALMAQIQAAYERATQEAQRAYTALDLRGRLADVRAGMGDPVGAARMRGRLLEERGGVISNEIQRLEEVLDQAKAAGNEELVIQISERIADLRVQMKENELAIRDNTVAIRQASIDQILNRAQFRTGVASAVQQIFEKVGALTGQVNMEGQIRALEMAGAEYTRAVEKLQNQLRSGYGVDLRGLHGEALANAVLGIDFTKEMRGMTEAERQQFEALINSILENENALLDNTQALKDLKGELAEQNFQSTAWQWFRRAIFTGSGGLLPDYQIPQMQSGGFVTRSGIFNLHAGEAVIPASRVATGGLGEKTEINITSPVEVADPVFLASRIEWERKQRRR